MPDVCFYSLKHADAKGLLVLATGRFEKEEEEEEEEERIYCTLPALSRN